jgi:hypothetical protein
MDEPHSSINYTCKSEFNTCQILTLAHAESLSFQGMLSAPQTQRYYEAVLTQVGNDLGVTRTGCAGEDWTAQRRPVVVVERMERHSDAGPPIDMSPGHRFRDLSEGSLRDL